MSLAIGQHGLCKVRKMVAFDPQLALLMALGLGESRGVGKAMILGVRNEEVKDQKHSSMVVSHTLK